MKIQDRIKASSLFETIVGLMVILLVFGIAMTIYVNIIKNSTSLAELRAAQFLEKLAGKTKTEKSYFNESFEEEGWRIEKKVGKYKDQENLLLVELKAFDQASHELATQKELIEIENEE